MKKKEFSVSLPIWVIESLAVLLKIAKFGTIPFLLLVIYSLMTSPREPEKPLTFGDAPAPEPTFEPTPPKVVVPTNTTTKPKLDFDAVFTAEMHKVGLSDVVNNTAEYSVLQKGSRSFRTYYCKMFDAGLSHAAIQVKIDEATADQIAALRRQKDFATIPKLTSAKEASIAAVKQVGCE